MLIANHGTTCIPRARRTAHAVVVLAGTVAITAWIRIALAALAP